MRPSSNPGELTAKLQDELQRLGFTASVFSLFVTGRLWCLRLEIEGRTFTAGVNHRGLYCWEISADCERNLVPPAVGPVFGHPLPLACSALGLIAHALRDPEFAFGEPQIL